MVIVDSLPDTAGETRELQPETGHPGLVTRRRSDADPTDPNAGRKRDQDGRHR